MTPIIDIAFIGHRSFSVSPIDVNIHLNIYILNPQIKITSISKEVYANLPEDHPLKRLRKLKQEDKYYEVTDPDQAHWTCDDIVVHNDFRSLKAPEVPEITTLIPLLREFYLSYFGVTTRTDSLGPMICQIIAHSINFHDENKLVTFGNGTIDILPFIPSSDLDAQWKRFSDKPEDYIRKPTVPQAPPAAIGPINLAGNNPDDGPSNPEHPESSADIGQGLAHLGHQNFRNAVITAFKAIDSVDVGEGYSHLSYKALHRTATFLCLVMFRRINKRNQELDQAFSRGNIHKHYTDMVKDSLSTVLPAPAALMNSALDQALSLSTNSGRQIVTMIFHLASKSTTPVSQAAVGPMTQTNAQLNSVLRATCLTHISGTGLQMITLFIAFKTLYAFDEEAAFEALSYKEFHPMLSKLIDFRTEQKAIKNSQPPHGITLFPFCRIINPSYHKTLGSRGSETFCYFLACLIDAKNKPASGTGGATAAVWTESIPDQTKIEISNAARYLFADKMRTTITSTIGGPSYDPKKIQSGIQWRAPMVQQEDPDIPTEVINFK